MNFFRVAIILTLLVGTTPSSGQDCDALVQQRPVPDANSFVYATPFYTMQAPFGSVTFNALTADGAVAVVFLIGDAREKCVDADSRIRIRFTSGARTEMRNGGGANCESRFTLYFSQELGNMYLLNLFRTEKIKSMKVWLSNKRWLELDFASGMAYNLQKSMNCLAEQIGAPLTASPARTVSLIDSLDNNKKILPPKFKGGDKALRTYFGRHMRRRSIVDRGVVVVAFTVDQMGKVINPKVMRGVNPAVDNEARRLVSTLPNWQPALKDGVPVSAEVRVNIEF